MLHPTTIKQEIKFPKKDAIIKIREAAERLRNQPPSSELVDALKKPPAKSEDKPKKIAASKRTPEPDMGV